MKKHVPNLRTVINQPAVFMQDSVPCPTAKFVKTFLSEEVVTVMERPAQSPDMNPIENVLKLLNEEIRNRIQETSKNYGLIWKKNGRKYPLMNARHQFIRVAKYVKLLLKVKVYTSSTKELWTLFLFIYIMYPLQ